MKKKLNKKTPARDLIDKIKKELEDSGYIDEVSD